MVQTGLDLDRWYLDELKGDSAGSEDILKRLMELARTAALAEMASGIAHELNQPLGAIATFGQAGERLLSRAEPLVSRAREVFQHISVEAMNAGEGIRRIRRLFDHAEPTRVRCQMSELVGEVAPAFHAMARGAHVSLRVNAQSPMPEVNVDRLRIQLVLFSLVQNAIEASAQTDTAHVLIELRADRYAVETSIIDSGAGVPADLTDKLFRPFFTTKSGGTGLGLASSRASIEAHEGSIGFDKATPTGSRFWFRVPIVTS
jgi:C4-dicarboxylate-specific signal transduction histidine kinase